MCMGEMEGAMEQLKKGGFIAVYDGDSREGEADLMIHPKFVTPKAIEKLRKEAGGLICFAIGKKSADKLGLPFYTEMIAKAGLGNLSCKKTAYGDEPAFSLPFNHKGVYTGITDNDRALTIREMEKAINTANAREIFEENFYVPGHVFLLIGRGLGKRKGHTELGLELAERAGLSECIVMCEMLGEGKALNGKEAGKRAKKNKIPFVEGAEIYGEKKGK